VVLCAPHLSVLAKMWMPVAVLHDSERVSGCAWKGWILLTHDAHLVDERHLDAVLVQSRRWQRDEALDVLSERGFVLVHEQPGQKIYPAPPVVHCILWCLRSRVVHWVVSELTVVTGLAALIAVPVQIVGIDAENIRGHNAMYALVKRHVTGVMGLFKHHPRPVQCIVMPESGTGIEGSHIEDALKEFKHCSVLHETGKNANCGMATTAERKHGFVSVLEGMFNDDSIGFSKVLVSDRETANLDDLRKQLGHYRRVNSDLGKSSAFAKSSMTYSGKVSTDGKMLPHLFQDDLCMALQLLAYWARYVRQRRCKFFNYTLYDSELVH
jgi:hypothetical protein